jgi:hypothetical protein
MEKKNKEKQKIDVDFVLLIMNCKKYTYKAEKQRETWLKTLEIPYYHVLGNPNLDSDFLLEEDVKILWVKTPDDYVSLPKKVIASYKAIMKTYTPSYILKTDDDQILCEKDSTKFFKTIMNIVKLKSPKVHYAGNIVNVPHRYLSKYHTIHPELPEYLPVYETKYCSGRFYILSSEAVYDLIIKTDVISNEYLEDYAVGFHMNSIFKNTILHINTAKYFKDME